MVCLPSSTVRYVMFNDAVFMLGLEDQDTTLTVHFCIVGSGQHDPNIITACKHNLHVLESKSNYVHNCTSLLIRCY